MGINSIDRQLRNRGKKNGKKNDSESKSAEAGAMGAAPDEGVRANTDSDAKHEENGTNVPGRKNESGKDEPKKLKTKKLLRQAVKEAIRDQSSQVATALLKKVVDGDKRSTEMMFSLIAKKKKACVGSSRHGGLTAADLLGSEDVWESETEEAMEGESQAGMGGREPEGQG